ncbi:MAG: ester cyclase [SAR202 cluster bacterium]|nr:ester cyclase [SAR202 cluster bacterium]
MSGQTLAEKNKHIVHEYTLAVQRNRDFDAIERTISPGFYNHDVIPGLPRNREGSKQLFALLWEAFPDMNVEIHDQVAEGDLVVTRKTITGTHKGKFLDVPPTGRPFRLEVMDILEVKKGKITAHWAVADLPGFWKQLGVER